MTTQTTAPAEDDRPITRRYRVGDQVTITTEHGPRHGRITAYALSEQPGYVVQVDIPEHEINATTRTTV